MTQDGIIEMAKSINEDWWLDDIDLQAFAKLVAEKEREACAKVCDELHWPWHMGDNSGPKECAAAIRARGQA
jgi:hypothetical protein